MLTVENQEQTNCIFDTSLKKRLKYIFFISAITACVIILFQLYWVYYTYKTGERNFIRAATYALEKSIDIYQLQQNQLPTSLKYKDPTLTVFMRTIPNRDSIALDTPKVIKRFHAEFVTVSIDKNHLSEVQTLMARLLSQQMHKPLNADTLNTIFQQQLQKENNGAAFRLIILKNHPIIPAGKIAATVNFYKSPIVVEARLLQPGLFFLKQNTLPVLVSITLILLSAGSLFYMGTIIRKQMSLDGMKNDFINNITHEFRTPLSILKSSNEALASFGAAEEPEKLARYLQINSLTLDKLDLNIERVLEIGRYEHDINLATCDPVDLHSLINQLINRLDLHDDTMIRVNYNLPFSLVNTDSFIIDTILTNLIDNALKYSKNKISIEININPVPKGWQLQVADNGLGMENVHLPYIFDKFYRIPAGDIHEIKGYGLGLNYVQQLVGALKGKISVSSQVNKGTIFTIEFPA